MKFSAPAVKHRGGSSKESPMELVSPSATTAATPPQNVDPDVPGQPARRPQRGAHGTARTRRELGNRGRARCSEVSPSRPTSPVPGSSACRAGPSVRSAPNSSLPPVASLALVFGGLILLSRVWFGFLRHLNGHHGFPVKRVVLVVAIWAVPLLLAPPLFSRDVYTYSAQGEMMSHHINPVLLRARGARGDPVQRDGRHGVVGDGIAVRSDLLERGRPARPGLGPPDPA